MTENSSLDILKSAILLETRGKAFYRTAANQSTNSDVKAFFETMAAEEVQHGEALGRWAQLADPDFDFDAAVARFRAGFRVPLEVDRSVLDALAGRCHRTSSSPSASSSSTCSNSDMSGGFTIT